MSMEDILYCIPGDPLPLARARYGNGRVYDSQKQLKVHWGIVLQHQHQDREFYKGALSLEVTFYFKYPKSTANKYIKQSIIHHHVKPDLSNLIKFIEDVAQGILYQNDSRISVIQAQKLYDHENPRTEFCIREIYGKNK